MRDIKEIRLSAPEVAYLDNLVGSEMFHLTGVVQVVKKPVFSKQLQIVKTIHKKLSLLRPR